MTSIINEIATEFLGNILETLRPHEGMKWEETSAKLMKYCKKKRPPDPFVPQRRDLIRN